VAVITVSPQRVPMLDASTLEGRTRPALDDVGWVPIRLRYAELGTTSSRAMSGSLGETRPGRAAGVGRQV